MGRIRIVLVSLIKDALFWRLVIATLLTYLLLAEMAAAIETVPAGNRNAIQPPIPGASIKRTGATNSSFEDKYQKIYSLLQKDRKLRQKIIAAAKDYQLDPVHIAGAIIGEHTYNVDVLDRLQTYYIKGLAWANQNITFAYRGESVSRFVERPQFDICRTLQDSNQLWTCRDEVWNEKFRGQRLDGIFYPNKRFSAVFFQPFFAGQTFGLGQLNPLTALMMSDLVHKTSGLPKLNADNGKHVYRTIIDPDLTLPYIAATVRQSIDDYRDFANFDISTNPGITATLYNIGGSQARARILAAENKRRKAQGQPLRYPQENYYGWLVNEKIEDLQKLFRQ